MESNQGRDDDIFNYDEASVSDSDDSTGMTSSKKRKRSSKTSKEQYRKLLLFMESHSDFTRRKADDRLTLDWEIFCEELNLMGHAKHSPKEWRKVWSDYKGKKKAKTSISTSTNIQLETVFEATLPMGASSSYTAQHVDNSVRLENVSSQEFIGSTLPMGASSSHTAQHVNSIVNLENVSLQDDTILATEILKKLDRLVELHLEEINLFTDVKEMIKTKFNLN